MIDLAHANEPVDQGILEVPGAFVWWYLDLVDARGDGVVLIWAWGLPFLPGLAAAARAGRPTAAVLRPSLTVSVYQGGTQTCYLFQEYEPAQASWAPAQGRTGETRWRFGDTEISSVLRTGRREVRVELDCALPVAGRLTGTVQARGASCTGLEATGASEGPSDHAWAPLAMVAEGEARLRFQGHEVRLEGRAYHDRNAGRRPLHDLGIRAWSWGRLAFPGRELIWYQLDPEDRAAPARQLVLEVSAEGRVRTAEERPLTVGATRLSPFGLRSPRSLRFEEPDGEEVRVTFDHVVDDGPFYQRYLVSGSCGRERARGTAELVVPGRIDQAWMRPLVRMRVHRAAGGNSFWLPLFTGSRQGRVERLLSQLRPGGRAVAIEGRP